MTQHESLARQAHKANFSRPLDRSISRQPSGLPLRDGVDIANIRNDAPSHGLTLAQRRGKSTPPPLTIKPLPMPGTSQNITKTSGTANTGRLPEQPVRFDTHAMQRGHCGCTKCQQRRTNEEGGWVDIELQAQGEQPAVQADKNTVRRTGQQRSKFDTLWPLIFSLIMACSVCIVIGVIVWKTAKDYRADGSSG